MKNEKSTGSRAEYIEPQKFGQTIQKTLSNKENRLTKRIFCGILWVEIDKSTFESLKARSVTKGVKL